MGELVNFCAGTNKSILPAEQVDAILVNVFDSGSSEYTIKYTREMFDYAKTKNRMLDSSGFQLLMAEEKGIKISFDKSAPMFKTDKGVNLIPEHVVEVAVKLMPEIDIMTSLDFPIGIFSDPIDQEIEFNKKLGFNARWAKETARLRELYCPEIRFFLPIQAYSLEHMNIFFDLTGDISFDGLSLPVRNLDIKRIALFLIRFYQMGIRAIHILGSTSFFRIALASFFARHYFDWTSLDSTSWRQSAQFGQYLNPHDLSSQEIRYVIIDENIQNTCDCPWCAYRSFTDIKNMPDTDRTSFLRCHNFWVIDKACKDLYQHSGTVFELEQYLRRKSPATKNIDELISTLSLVDALKDQDIRVLEQMLIGS